MKVLVFALKKVLARIVLFKLSFEKQIHEKWVLVWSFSKLEWNKVNLNNEKNLYFPYCSSPGRHLASPPETAIDKQALHRAKGDEWRRDIHKNPTRKSRTRTPKKSPINLRSLVIEGDRRLALNGVVVGKGGMPGPRRPNTSRQMDALSSDWTGIYLSKSSEPQLINGQETGVMARLWVMNDR